MDPLPSRLEEFRSKEYWDRFFRKLDKKPFEWYGEWPELHDLILTSCPAGSDILVAGCGNSELSAVLYDEGRTKITNIDFSKVCIIEMLKKHVRSRPKMRWLVMDMTKMQFPDASFDIVVDKGGLDALTGEPGDEGATAGAAFIREVKRVLRPATGRYLCVTLAQEHVIDLLLSTLGPGWHVNVHLVPLPSDGSDPPFRTFFLEVRNVAISSSATSQLHPITVSFNSEVDQTDRKRESAGNLEARRTQLRDLLAAVKRYNDKCTLQGSDTCQHLKVAAADFDALHPGRRVVCYLGLANPELNPTANPSSARFTATVLDAHGHESAPDLNTLQAKSQALADSFNHQCAVFLIPQGREHEWLFASAEGQWQLIEQVSAARLIFVMLNRGHSFGGSEQVQAELSPLVKGLAPLNCRGAKGVIPYLTTNDGIGKRTILEEAISPITGSITVEDVEIKSDLTGTFRRMVFVRNQNLVQSEAALMTAAMSAESKKKRGGKEGKRSEERRVDHSLLTSEYHGAMVAGLALVMPLLEAPEEQEEMAQVLVIGLGGGALPMFLHNHLPLKVKVVELDPVVAQLAERHFGFVQDDRIQLHIGDGIKVVKDVASSGNGRLPDGGTQEGGRVSGFAQANGSSQDSDEAEEANRKEERRKGNGSSKEASREVAPSTESVVSSQDGEARDQRWAAIFVDVDAGDASLSVSCPAPAFLELDFLLASRAALKKGGMLVMNVVSRAAGPYASVCASLKEVFRDVYEFDVDGNVNRVIFALNRAPSQGRNVSFAQGTTKLVKLATSHGPWGRGPSLDDLCKGIRELSAT